MADVIVATHGHCFDGLCSAVMFTKLLRHMRPSESLAFEYLSCGYGPGQNGVDPKLLSAKDNAILDFRFSISPNLTWYFDHHVTAFSSPDEEVAFASGVPSGRFFHDGAYSSCTKLIADIGTARFGVDWAGFENLIHWADMIDSAAFPSAEMAVLRKEPELRMMTVIEHMGDAPTITKFVDKLLTNPLSEVAASDEIERAYEPLGRAHEAFVTLVEERARERGGVVLVDLSSLLLEVAGKFVTYALYPNSLYSVVVSRSKSKCKISIGYNPWAPAPRRHNIADICKRHGGGGHPVVGAISLPANDVEAAVKLAESIAEELEH